MGCDFGGTLNQSVAEMHEANLGGTDSASYIVHTKRGSVLEVDNVVGTLVRTDIIS